MTKTYWQVLYEAIGTITMVRRITDDVGILEAEINWDQAAMDAWQDVLDLACQRDRFDALHTRILAEVPATTRDRLTAVKPTACRVRQPTPGAPWYRSADACDARFVGAAAHRPVINRSRLRSGLREFLDGFPVLLVFGDSGSGRSHSWYLIEHVARTRPRFTAHLLKIEREFAATDCTPLDLMRAIAELLDVDPGFAVDATSDTAPRLLITQLRKRLADLDGTQCLVIDGVDRPTVLPQTRALIRDLIERVANEEVRNLQLVVTGRREPHEVWDSATMKGILAEDIAPIDDLEIQRFFELTAQHIGKPLDSVGARALVDRLNAELGGSTTLEALGTKAAELARRFAEGGL